MTPEEKKLRIKERTYKYLQENKEKLQLARRERYLKDRDKILAKGLLKRRFIKGKS